MNPQSPKAVERAYRSLECIHGVGPTCGPESGGVPLQLQVPDILGDGSQFWGPPFERKGQ